MIEFIAVNMAPIMFASLIIFLLLGYPVAFALAANGLLFFFIGVELAPLPALISAVRLARYRHCSVHWRSLWKFDLSEIDVAFAFLSPVPMPALWKKAVGEMRPGALFISSSFGVPGQAPDQVVILEDGRQTQLFVWQMAEFSGNT